jgi:protein SCO1/2
MNNVYSPELMSRGRPILSMLYFAIAVLAAVAFPLAGRSESQAGGSQLAAAPVDGLPAVTLLDQRGRPFSLSSLKGTPVLVGFIHTSCNGPCEMMTARMKTVAESLGPKLDARVTMVTITTDPEHDRPAQMLAYAKAQGANENGWMFLSGKPADVRRVLALYNVSHEESEDDEMTHVFELFLIARDGRQIRHYQGTAIPPGTIASDIRKTLAQR